MKKMKPNHGKRVKGSYLASYRVRIQILILNHQKIYATGCNSDQQRDIVALDIRIGNTGTCSTLCWEHGSNKSRLSALISVKIYRKYSKSVLNMGILFWMEWRVRIKARLQARKIYIGSLVFSFSRQFHLGRHCARLLYNVQLLCIGKITEKSSFLCKSSLTRSLVFSS